VAKFHEMEVFEPLFWMITSETTHICFQSAADNLSLAVGLGVVGYAEP